MKRNDGTSLAMHKPTKKSVTPYKIRFDCVKTKGRIINKQCDSQELRNKKMCDSVYTKESCEASSETQLKNMEDIVRILNNIWTYSENIPSESQQSSESSKVGREISNISLCCHERSNSAGFFLLENDYSEESFEFSARSFFSDKNGPSRSTRQ